MQKEFPIRKKLRLQGYDYSSEGYYFITVCVEKSHEMLGRIVGDAVHCVPSGHCVPRVELSDIGKAVKTHLEKMNTVLECAFLEKYVIMPNHVHLLIAINNGTQRVVSPTIGTQRTASPTKAVIPRIVHGMKTVATKQHGFSIWQRGYHDHIIRSESEYQRIWQYIDENPARWTEDQYHTK